MSILITGGCGFIGSNFIVYLMDKYPQYNIINLDKLTYAGSISNLKEIQNFPHYTFIKGDVCNRRLVERIFKKYDVRAVIHFAAETHVDNSIITPGNFIKTNIEGTFTLIDVAKNFWFEKPFTPKKGYENSRFHHISTDEVYGSLSNTGYFTETSPYAPKSPYSASKASSDFIVLSYFSTYGVNIVISHSSNNYGPKQHLEKFIPTIIYKAIHLEKIPVYGNGKNVRDWIFVEDHCKAIDLVFHYGKPGEKYNVGASNEKENISVTFTICHLLDEIAPQFKTGSKIKKYKDLITFVKDRPGHDWRYAINPEKIENELGWHPSEEFEPGLRKTIKWYLENSRHS